MERYFNYFVQSSEGMCPFNCNTATPLNSTQAGSNTQWIHFYDQNATDCRNGMGYCVGATAIGCTECEADSLRCINDNKIWVPSSTEGECKQLYKCDQKTQLGRKYSAHILLIGVNI